MKVVARRKLLRCECDTCSFATRAEAAFNKRYQLLHIAQLRESLNHRREA
jgi:hypothetical protein